jgi:magnesium transporter
MLNPLDRDFVVLQERFGLHSLAIQHSMSPTQIPKVDVYDDQIFVVLKIARLKNLPNMPELHTPADFRS